MNIHPILVHFPIAFLTIYSLCEIFTVGNLKNSQTWWKIKAFLLVVGFLGTVAAITTGEMAEESIKSSSSIHNLVETHASFAVATEWLFGVLAFSYVAKFFADKNTIPFMDTNLVKFVIFAIKKILFLSVPLALVGLVLVTITGSLGGAIVYGPDVDPIVSFIYKIFIGY